MMESNRNALLAALPLPELGLLARHFRRVSLDPAAVLQEQEATVEWVYFPLSGAVSLLAVMQSGETIETAIIGREGAVGLFADFGPWRACTRAVVQAAGIAECIALTQLRIIVSQSEPIRRLMLRYRETLSAQAHQAGACNALHSVEQRMARWLLQMADRLDDCALPITQDTLSQMLGARRTTVTLVAQALQQDGVIRYRRGRIEVADRAALGARACECYATCRRRTDAVLSEAAPLQAPALA